MINNIAKSDNALRTIGEVAEELKIATHVLRFWESKFPQIKPKKRRGRRYYRSEDVVVLKDIQDLLYNQGYTIRGVQKFLSKNYTRPSTIHSDKQDSIVNSDNVNLDGNLVKRAGNNDLLNEINEINKVISVDKDSKSLSENQKISLKKVLYELIKSRNTLEEVSFSN